MARHSWTLRRLSSRSLRSAPYPIPSWKVSEEGGHKPTVTLEKKDWKKATCSVCMEYPHNAVLLLCSSHDKGCRPYMCGTSYLHSNCLDQFKKACTKTRTSHDDYPSVDIRSLGSNLPQSTAYEKSETLELSCPLCRGQVKGWTVVVPAREYLNNKKRSCMHENCSFVGTYKELSKHVRAEHPSARPRAVDPTLEQKWRSLENEIEQQDVMSTIRSSMPRSVVFGDYVIDMSNTDLATDDEAAGEGEGDADWDNRGISRSILYFILRQSAHLLRLHGENGLLAAMEEDQDNSSLSRDVPDAYEDDADPIQRSGRQRRRRRRSRGRLISRMH